MQRSCMSLLNKWIGSARRKPLVIRGARQVGKTWIVRQFAKEQNKKLLEINFEKQKDYASYFSSNDPKKILLNLESAFSITIDPQKSILFLDEIQAVPEIFAKLRWFAEDMPELPVIAAGSLLEFMLGDHSFSMPVGRIAYLHLEPLTFEEFLLASNRQKLVDFLKSYHMGDEIPAAMHTLFLSLFKEYIFVGGMPDAVQNWIEQRSLQELGDVQRHLIDSYKDDFNKYKTRIDIQRLLDVLQAVPRLLAHKFVYKEVNPLAAPASLKHALDLLCLARVCTRVQRCSANGIPLGSQIQERYFKAIFIDVGLCSIMLGLSFNKLDITKEINLINSGGIAEQVVGQMLRALDPFFIKADLYYWAREKGGDAEVDYVMQHGTEVIPIEVKAGKTGKLKSLHVFMGLKKYKKAVRINSDIPTVTDIDVKDYQGNPVQYKLLSLPFYMLSEVHRLLDEIE